MAKKGKAARQAARKTEGRKEGLAWIAALIRSKIEEYRAHEPPAPVAGDDVRVLRRCAHAARPVACRGAVALVVFSCGEGLYSRQKTRKASISFSA